jgi:hypothetical protein
MKIQLTVIMSLCLIVPSAIANDALPEVTTAFKKLETLKGYRITRTQEAPPQIMAQMAQNPQMASMLASIFKPTIVEFANPGRIQRFYSTIPSPNPTAPSLKSTTIISDKVLATLIEYASEKDKQLAESSGGQNSSATSSVGNFLGILENPFGALGGLLLGEIGKATFQNPVGKWTCTATKEDSTDLSKSFSSARQLGKSTIKNEPTIQYEVKSGEIVQIVDISLRNGLPLRSVINTKMEGMGEMKIIDDYYDFDALVKIEMPKC